MEFKTFIRVQEAIRV